MKDLRLARNPTMHIVRRIGFSTITPFVFSLAWILIPDKIYASIIGGLLAFFSLGNLNEDLENEMIGRVVLSIWLVAILCTPAHSISVTRTTVLIAAPIWGVILTEATYWWVKEKIEIVLPRGPIA